MSRVFITDKEVAAVIEVSTSTLSRLVGGFRRGGGKCETRAFGKVNLMDAKPVSFGGYRRWRVSDLARVLGISVDDLEKRIS